MEGTYTLERREDMHCKGNQKEDKYTELRPGNRTVVKGRKKKRVGLEEMWTI